MATELKQIDALVDHIIACANLWEKSGVSRVRSISFAAAQIRKLAQDGLWEQNGFISRAESDKDRAHVEAD